MSKPIGDIFHNFNELFESGVEEAFQQSIFDFSPVAIYVNGMNPGALRRVNKKVFDVDLSERATFSVIIVARQVKENEAR